jgi:Na+-driven multidrug efflux pump
MLSSGGLGLSHSRFRSTLARSQLSADTRQSLVASAHGYRTTTRSSSSDTTSAARQLELAAGSADRITALRVLADGGGGARETDHFLGTGSMDPSNLPTIRSGRALRADTPLLPPGGEHDHGTLPWWKRCMKRVHPPLDTMTAGMRSTSGEPSEADAPDHDEWSLIMWLAAPMLLGKLADEGSTIGMSQFNALVVALPRYIAYAPLAGMIMLWGRLGTQRLAAANLAWTWIHFTMVIIEGAQQALYSLVPQAMGSGRTRELGTILTSALLWTCVVLIVPISCVWLRLGSIIEAVEGSLRHDDEAAGGAAAVIGAAGSSQSQGGGAGGMEFIEPVDVETIQSFINASFLWLLPYVMCYTLMFWLECLEIVGVVSLIAGVWTLARVAFGWAFMFPLCDPAPEEEGCLDGYAYGMAVSAGGQLLTMLIVIFAWKKLHLRPVRLWHGFNCRAAVGWALNCRYLSYAAPLALQAALVSWHSTIFNMLMAEFGATQVAGYAVADAITGSGGAISLAIYAATSIRVGICLGEGSIPRAKRAAVAGCVYAALTGVIECVALLAFKRQLATLFAPEDEMARELIEEGMLPVAIYYFLESVAYGLWAVLEGQMRVRIATIALIVGHWVVSVPLGFYMLRVWLRNHCEQERNAHPTTPNDPTSWRCDSAFLERSPLELAWWCNCIGGVVTCVIMFAALLVSKWEALQAAAQEELLADGGAELDVESAQAAQHRADTRELLIKSGRLLGRSLLEGEKQTFSAGQDWVGSVGDAGSVTEADDQTETPA